MEPPTNGEAMVQMLEATMVTMERLEAGDRLLVRQVVQEGGAATLHLALHHRDHNSGMEETITLPPWPGGLMMEALVSGEASLRQEA